MDIIAPLFSLGIMVFVIAGVWKVFEKAGEPGWAMLIPIYNTIKLLKIVNKPWWWLFLMMVPILNFVIIIIVMSRLAGSFGKTTGFTVGLILLGPIFLPILGFGDAQYKSLPD
jgi:Family of unknown function (DUF5684)